MMSGDDDKPGVISVSKSKTHTFTKSNCNSISLLSGLGVEDDAHLGVTVKHRSRVKADPSKPNLRQVHLLHMELLDCLKQQGFHLKAGDIGENITTSGVALLELPRDTELHIGTSAIVSVKGLRNPCRQLDAHQDGLMQACLSRDLNGNLIGKAGVMGTVINSGIVKPGDDIQIVFPTKPYLKLDAV